MAGIHPARPRGGVDRQFAAVEFDVETRVDDIEARHPKEHGRAQHRQRHHHQHQVAADRFSKQHGQSIDVFLFVFVALIDVFAENDGHPMPRLEQRQSATHIHLDWLQAESICDQLSKLLAAREDQSDKFIKRYLERNGQL